MKNSIISAVLGAVVGACLGLVVGMVLNHQEPAGASPVGANFLQAKVAAQAVVVSTSTSYSVLNTDASDRVIIGAEVMLTGETTSTSTQYTLKCATSTVASSLLSNTNYILQQNVSFNLWAYGSTTGGGLLFMSSSSPGITGKATSTVLGTDTGSASQWARIWATGTYLNCVLSTSGGSASNLFGSGMTGVIAFPYRAQ